MIVTCKQDRVCGRPLLVSMGTEATKLLKMGSIWHLCVKAVYFIFPKNQLHRQLFCNVFLNCQDFWRCMALGRTTPSKDTCPHIMVFSLGDVWASKRTQSYKEKWCLIQKRDQIFTTRRRTHVHGSRCCTDMLIALSEKGYCSVCPAQKYPAVACQWCPEPALSSFPFFKGLHALATANSYFETN